MNTPAPGPRPAPNHATRLSRQTGATAEGGRLWRYTALHSGRTGSQETGELLAESAADVRAALRRIGLQALEVQPLRRAPRIATGPVMSAALSGLRTWWHSQLRNRRGPQRAEIYDSVSTMLMSGLPLMEAIQTIIESRQDESSRSVGRRSGGAARTMLVEMREYLRGGESLAQAMREHPGWFDRIDIAMIEAGQHGGNLPSVLADLAQRQERSSEISHKLWGALAYPLLVMLIGLGVVVFLSVKTLPDLTKILSDARIPIPGLTARVMWFGQLLAEHWPWLIAALAGALLARVLVPRVLMQWSISLPSWVQAIASRIRSPAVFRRMRVGLLVEGLSQLLRSGVPMVEALRVLAPAQRSGRLRRILLEAADRIEHGEDLSHALAGPSWHGAVEGAASERAWAARAGSEGGAGSGGWFDAEMRRLLEIGQASGEIEDMLTRIAARYERRAKRLIDRMTALLEPAVLLLLAVMVGTVVMAAVLPLLSLQEILK